MKDRAIGRRTFLTAARAVALTAAGTLDTAPGRAQQPVHNFSDAQPAKGPLNVRVKGQASPRARLLPRGGSPDAYTQSWHAKIQRRRSLHESFRRCRRFTSR